MRSQRIRVTAPAELKHLSVRLPLSKSISARALVTAQMAGLLHQVGQVSSADDTQRLHHLLSTIPYKMHCGLGGTTFRFLLALCAAKPGSEHFITGHEHLLQRPIRPLIDALLTLGADVEWHDATKGWLVKGKELEGGELTMDATLSSQFISALMMVAPNMPNGLRIKLKDGSNSTPYLQMTMKMMQFCGGKVEWRNDLITVQASEYTRVFTEIPPDWSAASFWYQIAALAPGAKIELVGMRHDGLQGDERASELWEAFVHTEVFDGGISLINRIDGSPATKINMADVPDLFIPLSLTYAALGVPAEFTGLSTLKGKESDRIATVAEVLEACEMQVEHNEHSFKIIGGKMHVATHAFATHHDHRIAMGLAPLCLTGRGIVIDEPDVVTKSYPEFWEHLQQIGFSVTAIA